MPINLNEYVEKTSAQDLHDLGIKIPYNIIINSGGVLMSNSTTNNMNGNNFNGSINGNIGQAGQSITQSSTNTITGIDDKVIEQSRHLIADLRKYINSLPENEDRQEALNDVMQLQEAVKNKKLERAQKIWGMFGDFVRTSSAGVNLAKFFGWL